MLYFARTDPCDLVLCAPHAHCDSRGHSAICKCEKGYIGDPVDRGCEPGKLCDVHNLPLPETFFFILLIVFFCVSFFFYMS